MNDETTENDLTSVIQGQTVDEVIQTIEIPINKIEPAKWQPREEFNREGLRDLAISIGENGLINPITVQKHEDGYQIIAGERRWRACMMIGKETIGARVIEVDEFSARLLSLVENFHRCELTDHEEEKFIYGLWEKGIENRLYSTFTSMSESTGITLSKISNSISAYEDREALKKIFKKEDFDNLKTGDINGSRPLDDIKARARLLKMKQDSIINQRELIYCCKTLNDVRQDAHDTAIALLNKQEITPEQIPRFIKVYDIVTPDIKDKLLDGEVTFEDALKFVKPNNSTKKTKVIEGSKPIERVNDDNDDNDVLKRFRFVYLEGIIALKANDISNIKNKEHQKTCIDFVQKIVTHCEDILSELGIAKE